MTKVGSQSFVAAMSGTVDYVKSDLYRAVILAVLVASLLHAFHYLIVGLNNPLFDYFEFRQTQTALTAYWMRAEGFSFRYQTPVLGNPWEVPFEFPLYQGLTALIASFGVPLDASGRIVSFVFFIACLAPLAVLFRALRLGHHSYLFTSVLFVTSPFYIFWSRTFMIESTALFFGLLWLAVMAVFIRSGHWWALGVATAAGALSVLTKSTTFPAFGLLAGFLILKAAYDAFRTGSTKRNVLIVFSAGTACVVVLAIGFGWVAFTDAIKAENPFGAEKLTSAAVASFTFGTMEQRFSGAFWRDVILNRCLVEILGYTLIPAVLITGAALMSRKYALFMAAAVVAFLVPLLLFTNLHRIHSYYQYANGLFVLVAVGFGLAALIEAKRHVTALAGLLVLTGGQVLYFHHHFANVIEADYTQRSRYKVSQLVRQHTAPNESVLVFGDDWSSAIPYYSQRKSLAMPYWASTGLIEQTLLNPQAVLGDRPLGVIVSCGTERYGKRAPLIDAFLAARDIVNENGPCRLYAAQTSGPSGN